MSILIKGMEMPTKCEACVLARLSDTGESLLCGYTFDTVPWGDIKPPDNCPLVPVPPHGRLIDADVLAAECDSPHWCVWLSDIDAAPTVVPAEEAAK